MTFFPYFFSSLGLKDTKNNLITANNSNPYCTCIRYFILMHNYLLLAQFKLLICICHYYRVWRKKEATEEPAAAAGVIRKTTENRYSTD